MTSARRELIREPAISASFPPGPRHQRLSSVASVDFTGYYTHIRPKHTGLPTTPNRHETLKNCVNIWRIFLLPSIWAWKFLRLFFLPNDLFGESGGKVTERFFKQWIWKPRHKGSGSNPPPSTLSQSELIRAETNSVTESIIFTV